MIVSVLVIEWIVVVLFKFFEFMIFQVFIFNVFYDYYILFIDLCCLVMIIGYVCGKVCLCFVFGKGGEDVGCFGICGVSLVMVVFFS